MLSGVRRQASDIQDAERPSGLKERYALGALRSRFSDEGAVCVGLFFGQFISIQNINYLLGSGGFF